MTWNYQLWEEKQSQAWTGHGRMQKVRPQQTYRELLDFAGCRIFSYQTNKHLFQCRLAVELLLLLKLPPKCHTHIPQNLCCSCTSATVPQVWAPPNWVFNVQWQLSFGEVSFFSQSMNRQWWHKVSPLGSWFRQELSFPGDWAVAQWCHQETGAAAAVEQSTVPRRGQQGKLLTQSCFEEGGRKEETTPAIHFSPSSTIYTSLWETSLSTIEFLRLKSDFTHRSGRALLVQHHPRFVCFLKWLILSPFSKRGSAWTQLSVWLFCLAKRSLLFSFFYIQGLPTWLPLFFQREKNRIHCFCFSTGTIQLLFSMSQNTTDKHQHSELTKGQGTASKIHYLQEMGGSFYKFCAR